jgi:hypothetical protein
MKVYTCGHCGNPLYFENSYCVACHHPVGFNPSTLSMITLESCGTGAFRAITGEREHYRFCANAGQDACNWLTEVSSPGQVSPTLFCRACVLNRTIPSLSTPENLFRWGRIEVAKRRLVYSLLRMGLPVEPKAHGGGSGEGPGIAFDFLADVSPGQRVRTGHLDGTITLNIEEADEAERTRNKLDLGERYRTLLGHFRHEIGHYYWDLLIGGAGDIDEFRELFGDERTDYGQALQAYYQVGPPASWADHFISPYASSHPWEDWAETWAHYMHLMDALETAYAFGLGIHPGHRQGLGADITKDPYVIRDFDRILDMWLPLTFAVNSLNRSMGHNDFYPFVISPAVMSKLRFIHRKVASER